MSTFNTYVDEIPSAVANIDFSITKINEQITELNTQIVDIKSNVLSVLTSAASAYLIDKAALLTTQLGETISVHTSGSFGLMTSWPEDNITEWALVSGASPYEGNDRVWKPEDINAGGPTAEDALQWQRQQDYEEAIEHLYREFNDDDAATVTTFGIAANYNGLVQGRDILTRDRNKLNDMYNIYKDFKT